MALCSRRLAGPVAIRRDPDRGLHACHGYASRMADAVYRDSVFLAALGLADSCNAGPVATLSSPSQESRALGRACHGLPRHRCDMGRMGGADPFGLLWEGKFLGNLVVDVILYGVIVAISTSVNAHNRLWHQRAAGARLSESLAQAQLAALRVQIEPHFIFNSLDAVTDLIREKRDHDAIAVIAALGDLLRRVTDRSPRQFVTMREEGEFLRQYLEIQQLRFAERLRYQIDIHGEIMSALVPDFVLQALVENAIKHGISKRVRGGEIRVGATREAGLLTLKVFNDGPPLPEHIQEQVGLANTRQRLLALYGPAQELTLQNHATAGVLASITLPYREH